MKKEIAKEIAKEITEAQKKYEPIKKECHSHGWSFRGLAHETDEAHLLEYGFIFNQKFEIFDYEMGDGFGVCEALVYFACNTNMGWRNHFRSGLGKNYLRRDLLKVSPKMLHFLELYDSIMLAKKCQDRGKCQALIEEINTLIEPAL